MIAASTVWPLLLETLRAAFDARAAGWWRLEVDHLAQRAFTAASDMPRDVADTFASTTRQVPLTATDLGIVAAALSGQSRVSRAIDLPPDHGSGLWLRRFGARRSVAVPIGFEVTEGRELWVVSLALGDEPSDQAVASRIERAARAWRIVR